MVDDIHEIVCILLRLPPFVLEEYEIDESLLIIVQEVGALFEYVLSFWKVTLVEIATLHSSLDD